MNENYDRNVWCLKVGSADLTTEFFKLFLGEVGTESERFAENITKNGIASCQQFKNY